MTQANFLPAINTGFNSGSGQGTGMPGATGMSAVRTGLSFGGKTPKHVPTPPAIGISPIRSSSIVNLMSARDMVREFDRRGSNDTYGIEGYYVAKNDSPSKK